MIAITTPRRELGSRCEARNSEVKRALQLGADFIFMMEGDIQKFYDRKQEYSPKILKEHQDDLINGLTKEGLEFYSINANQDEEEVLKSILRKLGD